MNTTAPSLSNVTVDFLMAAADGLTRDPSGRRYSSATLEDLRIALRGHVAEELGDMPISSLRRWQVQAFVNELAGSGLAPRRLRAIVASLRALTRYAREQGLLDEDPTEGVTVPSEDDQTPRTFTTTDQLATVQPAAPSPVIPDAALWQLMKVVTVVFILIALVLAAESI